MASFMQKLRQFSGRFRHSEDGTATIPFVILFPMFLIIVVSSVEMGVLMIRHVMLERALDLAVRDLRLALWTPTVPANAGNELRARICNYAGILPKCSSAMMVELRPVSKTTWAPLSSGATCVNRNLPVNVNPTPTFGSSNELMLIRACIKFDPLFPMTGAGFHLPKDNTGAYALVATTAFVNEPRPGT